MTITYMTTTESFVKFLFVVKKIKMWKKIAEITRLRGAILEYIVPLI